FPSATATMLLPIFLSGSLKKTRKKTVNKKKQMHIKNKTDPNSTFIKINDNTKNIKLLKNVDKIHDFEPRAIFILFFILSYLIIIIIIIM
ncbi:MAG: hypothetical protein ACMUIU_14625, partial [bacterium]